MTATAITRNSTSIIAPDAGEGCPITTAEEMFWPGS
jgi:hypothetical protein